MEEWEKGWPVAGQGRVKPPAIQTPVTQLQAHSHLLIGISHSANLAGQHCPRLSSGWLRGIGTP